MTAKNYPEVVAKYSEYLKLTNYEDESRVFNCAFAAYNAKKYDDAIKAYTSIKDKYFRSYQAMDIDKYIEQAKLLKK